MFSRPVKSSWKPAPSSRSEPTEPPTSSLPSVGAKMPAIRRKRVVFPEPFRPTKPTDSPGRIVRSTSRTAQISVGRTCLRRTIASFSVRFRCG